MKKKMIIRNVIMALIGGIIGVCAAHFSLDLIDPLFDTVHPAWLLALIPLAAFAAILLHEAGHVIGGAVNGFQFLFMSVFMLKVEKTEDRISIGINRLFSGWGGLAVMLPPADVTRANYLWFIAGGPLASIVTTALSAVALIFIYPNQPFISLFCAISILMNGLIAFQTMLPIKFEENFDNDGTQFLDLARGGDLAERKLAMARLQYITGTGIRPADYPEDLILSIERPGEPDRDTVLAMLYRNTAQIDRKEWEAASETIQIVIRNIDKLPPMISRMTYLQAALVEGFNRRSAEAEEMMEKAGTKGWADEAFLALAKASVSFAAQRWDELPALLEEADRQILLVTDLSNRAFCYEIAAELRQLTENEVSR